MKEKLSQKSQLWWCNSSLNNNIKHNMWMFSEDVENGDRGWWWCDKSILSAQTSSSRRQKRLEFELLVMSKVLRWFQMHIISITNGYAQHSMLEMWANIEDEAFFATRMCDGQWLFEVWEFYKQPWMLSVKLSWRILNEIWESVSKMMIV